MLRKCLMECGIENGNLRKRLAQGRACRNDTLNVSRIVQRRELDAVFDAAQYLICYQHRAGETFPTMDHPMSNRMNVSDTVDFRDSRLRRDGPTKNHLHCRTRVTDWFGKAFG